MFGQVVVVVMTMQSWKGCNEYSFGSDQSFIGGVWESYYQLIYKANVILGRVEPDTDLKKKGLC